MAQREINNRSNFGLALQLCARCDSQVATGLHEKDESNKSCLRLPRTCRVKAIICHIDLSLPETTMRSALTSVHERMMAAVQKRPADIASGSVPRLVAVSKLKPVSAIIEAYEYGQRFFGENYIQELETKSNSDELLAKCPDIKFHFIGHLQSNKVNKLLKVRNLHMVETVDSVKLADLINKAIERRATEMLSNACADTGANDKLKVLIQVNTSGEEQKNGIQPDQAIELAEHISRNCQWLEFAGLMTIGRLEGWGDGPNIDFIRLYELRTSVAKSLMIKPTDLELSMGMSGDFEEAITMGSTNVRIGTMIFGERPAKKDS